MFLQMEKKEHAAKRFDYKHGVNRVKEKLHGDSDAYGRQENWRDRGNQINDNITKKKHDKWLERCT